MSSRVIKYIPLDLTNLVKSSNSVFSPISLIRVLVFILWPVMSWISSLSSPANGREYVKVAIELVGLGDILAASSAVGVFDVPSLTEVDVLVPLIM